MASTFSPNVNLEEPARGDDVGTWDVPVNNNSTLLDLLIGGTTSFGLTVANVVLNSAQYSCANIVFTSTATLGANVTVTFPTSFKKPYTIQHLGNGSSQFTITLTTTAAGGQVIACPPGQPFDIVNDGTNIKFKNFGPPIGGYWDYVGSSVPAWVSGCTVPPYLYCNGGTFSSGTYPALAMMIGTTLPDLRGRVRAYFNDGTGRITSGSSTGGVDGNTLFASGGAQTTSLSSLHLPQLTDPGHSHLVNAYQSQARGPGPGDAVGQVNTGSSGQVTTANSTTGITYGSSAQQNFSNLPPMAIGGITMIRSA